MGQYTPEVFVRCDEWVIPVEFRDETNTIINLTTEGYTEATLTIRRKDTLTDTNDDRIIVQKHDTSLSDPTNGIHTFTIAKTSTNVSAGIYPHGIVYQCDVQLKKSSGGPHSTTPFEIQVVQDVTKTEP